MKKIWESPKHTFEDEEMTTEEQIFVFEYEDEEEAEDFAMLAYREQLSELGLKEEATPDNEHGKIHRYSIDPGDSFVIVQASTFVW